MADMDKFLAAVNGSPRLNAVHAATAVSNAIGVRGFFGPFRFLSNFHLKPVYYDGVGYKSNEHAYQAAKTLNLQHREVIRHAMTCKVARELGQQVEIRPGWHEGIRDEVMFDVNAQKYANGIEQSWLLATDDMYLEETNRWGDIYWGVCDGVGQNKLGKLLMEIRLGLREIMEDGTHGA